MSVGKIRVREVGDGDRCAVDCLHRELWHADVVLAQGRLDRPADFPGLIAERDGEPVGVLAFDVREGDCYVVAIGTKEPGTGVGSALLEALVEHGRRSQWSKIWLITTNDNLDALRFYQGKGFRLSRLHPGAIERYRHLKPNLPEIGSYGIPMRDEIELEMALA
jgi:ribosomal protein S18 acetylase RimI-like enzyme